jgi:hypothetical protein
MRSPASHHVISGTNERIAMKFGTVPPLLNVMDNVFPCSLVIYINPILHEAQIKTLLFSLKKGLSRKKMDTKKKNR